MIVITLTELLTLGLFVIFIIFIGVAYIKETYKKKSKK